MSEEFKHEIFALPIPITELEYPDLLMALNRNFKEIERIFQHMLVYENLTGLPINRVVDDVTEDGQLLTSKLNEKLVGLEGELQLADEAVTSAKLAVAAVLTDHVHDEAIQEAKIATGAITNMKIADGAVDEGKLGALAVTAAKLAEGAVTGAKIAEGSVGSEHIKEGAITNEKIPAGSIKEAQMNWTTHLLF